jgi:hypothetical protein
MTAQCCSPKKTRQMYSHLNVARLILAFQHADNSLVYIKTDKTLYCILQESELQEASQCRTWWWQGGDTAPICPEARPRPWAGPTFFVRYCRFCLAKLVTGSTPGSTFHS